MTNDNDSLNLIDQRVSSIVEEREKIKKCYMQIFHTESGREVLEDLKRLVAYDTPLGAQSVETCNYILAQREMMMYILNQIKEDK